MKISKSKLTGSDPQINPEQKENTEAFDVNQYTEEELDEMLEAAIDFAIEHLNLDDEEEAEDESEEVSLYASFRSNLYQLGLQYAGDLAPQLALSARENSKV